jgi:hypothetical protein
MARRPDPPDECSQCGAEIPRRALACPECGADENTGWDTNPWLPDGNMDVPDYLTEDYDPDRDPPIFDHQTSAPRAWWIVGLIVAALMVLVLASRAFF